MKQIMATYERDVAAHELQSVVDQLSTSYQRIMSDVINESLAILFYDLYTVLANRLVRASLRTLPAY